MCPNKQKGRSGKSKTILLTGATGFLGCNLLCRLLENNHKVTLLLRSSSNFARIKDFLDKVRVYRIENVDFPRLFQDEKIDAVVHCATNYGARIASPISVLEANLMLPLRLLQIGSENGLRCFINSDTILDRRISHYSLSKSQFRDWLKLYSSKIVCGNVALEHFYGPGDDDSKFVTFMIRSLLQGKKKIDLTPGEQKRDFIYIDDVVEAFYAIISNLVKAKPGFYPYEIGGGKTISIKEFMLLVKSIAKNRTTALNFGAFPYRENEVMESRVDLSAIRALGWKSRVPLENGLERTIHTEREKQKS